VDDVGVGTVRRNPPRADRALVDAFVQFGTATVHEAQGRIGVLRAYMRPIYKGAHVAGSAVTVGVPPGDNWMIHVAVEQCGDGDLLVVAPTEPCEHGYFGELLATAVQRRGVRGLVIEAGVRDIVELERMHFPVWSKHVSALGTVKERLGTVNGPLEIAGVHVEPGDIVVADDDGVVIVQRERAQEVLDACTAREAKEAQSRRRYAAGELSLDVSNMRDELERKGLRYE
jgi:4-hydroxy-4-methyl-2-oxoglutarate aldolase